MDNGQWTMDDGRIMSRLSGLIPISPIRPISCPYPVRVKSVFRPCSVRVGLWASARQRLPGDFGCFEGVIQFCEDRQILLAVLFCGERWEQLQ